MRFDEATLWIDCTALQREAADNERLQPGSLSGRPRSNQLSRTELLRGSLALNQVWGDNHQRNTERRLHLFCTTNKHSAECHTFDVGDPALDRASGFAGFEPVTRVIRDCLGIFCTDGERIASSSCMWS
eukprot:1541089-Rhodomonas_salina.1